MNPAKRFILRVVFTTEIFLFSFFYVFGINGLSALYRIEEENRALEQHILSEHCCLEDLKREIDVWQTSSFYQEKFARQKLQMIKKDEIVYFLS